MTICYMFQFIAVFVVVVFVIKKTPTFLQPNAVYNTLVIKIHILCQKEIGTSAVIICTCEMRNNQTNESDLNQCNV